MKKILKISYLALAFLLISSLTVSAQIKPSAKKKTEEPTEQEDTKPSPTKKKTTAKKTDDYFDESGGFKHRLWYGGNMNFSLSGLNGGSLFAIGVTPMVGYKIVGGLSAGPRVGITYTSIKASNTAGGVSSVGVTDYSLGAFTRYKAFQNFFVQAEFEYLSQQFPRLLQDSRGNLFIDLDANRKPIKQREDRNNYYAGIGYNSGGIFGYEILGLYNFNLPSGSREQPISLRIGFTYKF
jgi:hypothetical protein